MNPSSSPKESSLPYTDTKPQGAADFYLAINATFRFLQERLGEEGWIRYLRDMGKSYFGVVNRAWKEGGLDSVAQYWRDFFAAEPGSKVEVERTGDTVQIKVKQCPAIAHLRQNEREIVPNFCRHCFYLGETRASEAELDFRLEGGNGSCLHTYRRKDPALPPQDLAAIKEVTSC